MLNISACEYLQWSQYSVEQILGTAAMENNSV